MKRFGMVIGIRPERVEDYKRLHAAVWPAVLEQLRRSHVRDFTIYLREPEMLLFSHFVYVGEDFEADWAAMAADPQTQAWWAVCSPCQQPLASRAEGEHWAAMQEVFHMD
ncbi:L-rhamnose mutarotase [Roseateles sp. BYS180W]|uniref:L-rhamnose mutarotase n=1 Tax=Roseateles rivi TaxID=3299028 RepID=A0ABW7FWK1_9BURK